MRLDKMPSELKKFFPLAVFIIMTALFCLILLQEIKYEVTSAKINAQKELQVVSVSLSDLITKPVERMKGLKSYFEGNPDFESKTLGKMTERLFDPSSKLTRTVAITDKGIIKFIYPRIGNEQVIGVNLLNVKSQKEQTAKALQTGEDTLLGPLDVLQGWKALIHLTPLYADPENTKRVTGLLTLTINDEELFKESGIEGLMEMYYVKIHHVQPDLKESIILDTTEGQHYDFISTHIDPVDQHWKISVYPKGGWKIRYDVMVFLVMLWLIMAGSLTVLASLLLKKNARLENAVEERTKALVETNVYLENSLAENEEKHAQLEIMNEKLEKAIVELKYSQDRVTALEKISVINDMMNGIAHQLNTPLGNINLVLSYIKPMLEEERKSEGAMDLETLQSLDESLNIIENSIGKAIRIVANFKTLSFCNLNQPPEHIVICDFIDALMMEFMEERVVGFKNNIPENVGLVCNKPMLAQVISKIVVFFSEFADGEKRSTIDFDYVAVNEITVLQILIKKIHIPDAFRMKIFDPHLMMPSVRLTGLELFMSNFLAVKLLSGDLKYNYEEDDCHRFMIYLPEKQEVEEG